MHRIFYIVPLLLAACSTPPEAPVQAVSSPSLDALRALPPGADVADLGLQNGCYVLKDASGAFQPLTTAGGQQVCA